MNALANIENQIKSFKQNSALPAWAIQSSEMAIKQFKAIGLPTSKTEAWRFTPMTKALESQLKLATSFEQSLKKYPNRLYFLNGKLISDSSNLPEEIEIKSMDEITQDEFRQFASAFTNEKNNPFISLNHVFLEHTYFIKLKRNHVYKKPITFLYESKGESLAIYPQVYLIAQEGSQLTLVEKIVSNESGHFINSALNIDIKKNAKLIHLKNVLLAKEHIINTNTQAHVARDAHYTSFLISLSGKMVRHNLEISLNEAGASAASFGLYALNNYEHLDNHTFIHHKAAHTQSEQLFKGILDDNSKGIFTGRILVGKNAQQINSSQLNKTLLLSKTAQSHSQPQLEIFADDVKCSHGSTTGQLSPDEIFYLQSRGIDINRAKQILSHAYLQEILLKIDNKELAQELEQYVFEKFCQLQLGEVHA